MYSQLRLLDFYGLGIFIFFLNGWEGLFLGTGGETVLFFLCCTKFLILFITFLHTSRLSFGLGVPGSEMSFVFLVYCKGKSFSNFVLKL